MHNFLPQYENLATKDLLKITNNPTHYQKEAVDAATFILSKRDVTQEDFALANAEVDAQQKWLNRESDTIDRFKTTIGNFFTYLLRPSDELDVKRWVYIVCIITGVQYLMGVANSVNAILYTVRCETCSFGFIESLYVIDLILPVVTIILLLKRNKWGWRLLVFSSTLVLVFKVGTSISLLQYMFNNLVDMVPQLIISCGLLWFMYKKQVMDYFGESKVHFLRAALVGLLFAGAVMLYVPI